VINPLNSIQYYQALLKANIKAALHIFPQGDHNIALRNNPGSTQLWTTLCEAWMNEMGFLARPQK
jgi:dipeptidyl aminopeptidase/acylaminoacyl peptidase